MLRVLGTVPLPWALVNTVLYLGDILISSIANEAQEHVHKFG